MRDPQISLSVAAPKSPSRVASEALTERSTFRHEAHYIAGFTLHWMEYGDNRRRRYETLPEVLEQLTYLCTITGESGITNGSPTRLIWSDGYASHIVTGGLLWEYGRAYAEGWMTDAQLIHIEIMEHLGLDTE